MKVEEFIEFERRNNLFSLSYLGVYFWKISRQTVYNLLSGNKLTTHNLRSTNKLKNRIMTFLGIIKSMTYLRFNRRTSNRTMILTSSAYYLDKDGNRLDRIMNHLILNEENSIVINLYSRLFKPLDFLTHGRILHHYNHPIRILQNFILNRIYRIFLSNSCYTVNIDKLIIDLGLDSKQLKRQIIRDALTFIIEEKRAIRYFKRHRPATLYVSCGYGKEAFISAAQKQGVYVVEIQHGLINHNDLGYNYPGINNIPYFPNKLILFGEYWKKKASFPKNSEIGIESIPYYFSNIERIRRVRKTEFLYDIALFFGHRLPIDFLTVFIERNRRLKLILKPHPLTLPDDLLFIKNFCKSYSNITVSSDELNYYDIFAMTKFIVTISSTIMYEATACGVPVFVIKMGDFENNLDFIEEYNLNLVDQDYNFNFNEKHYCIDFVNGIFN